MKKEHLFLLGIACLFLFLRLFHLSESLNFGSDQGFGILEMKRLWDTKQITLIGPASSLTTGGHYIYVSSLVYYLSLFILLLSGWNPLALSYFLIGLHLLSFLFLLRVLRHTCSESLASFFALLFTFSSVMVDYSRFSWAPNYLIPLSCIVLTMLLPCSKKKIPSLPLSFFRIGLILGVGLQLHYSFFLAILLSFLWLLYIKKISIYTIGFLIGGITVGFSPILLFDLRHNFHNLRTFFLLFQTAGTEGSFGFDMIQLHYFLSLFPFLFFFISLFLSRIYRKNTYLVYGCMGIYILFSLFKILPIPSHGFTMPTGWNYQGLLKSRDIIIAQKKENYNVVDVLSGDTRAYGLRALLTLSHYPPLGITTYPSAQALFLYTREPVETILLSSLWEVASAKPLHVVEKWHIQNGIFLYLLEK